MFLGALILFAAVIAWATGLMMSPHGAARAQAPQQERTPVGSLPRNTAIGTMLLSAFAGWLLFPARRPRAPTRDWLVAGVLAVLVLSSLYQLIWLRTAL
jgi:drug/metabolite transporter (DMT)-like permease